MRKFSKIYPDKGITTETLQQAILLSNLMGWYLAAKSLKIKSLEYFQDIPTAYEEAVEFFINKLLITKDEFKKLEKEARRSAFTAAALEKETVLESVKKSLDNALKSGQTIEDWKGEIDMLFDSLGLTKLNNYYLDNIFRTNMQEALNTGKDIIFGQASEEEFPLMQWITVEDERVRPEHAILNGFTAPVKDPIWKILKAPLSWNCRCTRSLVHRDEGLKPSEWRPSLRGRGFEFVS